MAVEGIGANLWAGTLTTAKNAPGILLPNAVHRFRVELVPEAVSH